MYKYDEIKMSVKINYCNIFYKIFFSAAVYTNQQVYEIWFTRCVSQDFSVPIYLKRYRGDRVCTHIYYTIPTGAFKNHKPPHMGNREVVLGGRHGSPIF